MKGRRWIGAVMVLLAANGWANDAHHPDKDNKPAAASASQAAKPAPMAAARPAADTEQQFAQAQDHIKKMLTQMEQIRQTKDPKERQRLMAAHLQTMQQSAQAMRPMGGGMMMDMMNCSMMDKKGGASSMGMMGSQGCMMMGKSAAKPDTGKRVDAMEKRMDMMQMMMDQMIERESQRQ